MEGLILVGNCWRAWDHYFYTDALKHDRQNLIVKFVISILTILMFSFVPIEEKECTRPFTLKQIQLLLTRTHQISEAFIHSCVFLLPRYIRKSQKDCTAHTCEYLVTFERHGQDATFELSTTAEWAAIGFSSDKNMVRTFYRCHYLLTHWFRGDVAV